MTAANVLDSEDFKAKCQITWEKYLVAVSNWATTSSSGDETFMRAVETSVSDLGVTLAWAYKFRANMMACAWVWHVGYGTKQHSPYTVNDRCKALIEGYVLRMS